MKAAATKVEAAAVETAEVEATVETTALAAMAAEKQHKWTVVVVAAVLSDLCHWEDSLGGGCTTE